MNFKKNKIYIDILYIIFLGFITSFSLPPYGFWFINFFSFTLLFIFLIKNKDEVFNKFFLYGFFFGFGYFISSMYWIPLSLLYDQNFKFLIPVAIIIIPAFLSLFFGIAFCLFKFFSEPKSIFVNILIFSLILGFFEFIRGNILSGFPWNLFAYSFFENLKFIQVNSLIGIYSFNTLLITVFLMPSILFFKKKNDLIGFFIILLISFSIYIYGSIKIQNFENLEVKKLSTEIKVLSTNIPIERFYSTLDEELVLLKLISLSNPKKNNKTIFIWPEGIIPNMNLKKLKNEFNYIFKNSFSNYHNIILGINDDEILDNKKHFYNSLAIIDNEVNILFKYHKNKLVPFGEFLPLEKFLSKIGLRSLTNNYQSYSASKLRKQFNLDENSKIKFLPLICYEIIYSGSLSRENDYNFIVNISEDGWFGNSIGPYQHFAHSIFRSIENGKYTLRSANNGISAIVDPSGSIVDKINITNEGVITLNEIVEVNKTLFSQHGNKIYFLIILLYIFLIFSFKKLKNE